MMLERNSDFKDEEIFCTRDPNKPFELACQHYHRKISTDAYIIKLQYLSIEADMQHAFQYVLPIMKNIDTVSIKFATIIKESATLFEQVLLNVYHKAFIESTRRLTIKDLLLTDKILVFSREELKSPILDGEFHNSPVLNPFQEMLTWDGNPTTIDQHIPKWWSAYNKIKHTTKGVIDLATLENAIRSLGAAFIIINIVYGAGVVGGVLSRPEKLPTTGKNIYSFHHVEISKLFVNEEGTFALSFK